MKIDGVLRSDFVLQVASLRVKRDTAFQPRWWQRWRLERCRRQRGLGYASERAAGVYLKRLGYRVVAYNVRMKMGEVDVLAIARDETVVIVEVKSRSRELNSKLPQPEAMVSTAKQRKLSTLAGPIARRFGLADRAVRFDVIGIDWPEGGTLVLRHHEGAFEYAF